MRRLQINNGEITMDIINPATGQLITKLPDETVLTVQSKFEKLKTATQEWSKLFLSQRKEIVEKFSFYLEEEKAELARTLSDETGKPLQQAINEINGAR